MFQTPCHQFIKQWLKTQYLILKCQSSLFQSEPAHWICFTPCIFKQCSFIHLLYFWTCADPKYFHVMDSFRNISEPWSRFDRYGGCIQKGHCCYLHWNTGKVMKMTAKTESRQGQRSSAVHCLIGIIIVNWNHYSFCLRTSTLRATGLEPWWSDNKPLFPLPPLFFFFRLPSFLSSF